MSSINTILPFSNSEFSTVRALIKNNEPWIVAKDITENLGLPRPSQSTRYLDADEKGMCLVNTPSGKQKMVIVSEAGLYSLIFKSRKPEAKAFKHWVTHEVLPSIRKTGSYSVEQTKALTSQVDRLAQLQEKQSEENLYLLNKLQTQQQEIERLQKQQKASLPAPRLGAAEGAMSTTQALRYLKYHYPHITRDWIFAKLRSSGCMCKNSCEPTVNGMRHGIVVPKIDVWVDYKGVKHVGRQYSHITSIGLDWLMFCARFEAMEAVR